MKAEFAAHADLAQDVAVRRACQEPPPPTALLARVATECSPAIAIAADKVLLIDELETLPSDAGDRSLSHPSERCHEQSV